MTSDEEVAMAKALLKLLLPATDFDRDLTLVGREKWINNARVVLGELNG